MMLFGLFRPRRTAAIARDRLQVLLSHERAERSERDLLGLLRGEILAAITKHVVVDPENIRIQMDRGAIVSTLEIDIEIPHSMSDTAPIVPDC
jgi:cell division topological specificity factor